MEINIMMDLKQIRESILNINDIHEDTGISISYLYKLRSGEKKNPTYEKMQTLSDYFSK
ncbi:MAG: transcriptional regulator with XRE-family HTH domain [Francisellaceae bacterium]|jgi:transcriptional regulator with XRE-family HTH domain